jgi:hypothetical protein
MANWPSYSETRFPLLGLTKIDRVAWRFVCLDWHSGGTRPDAPGTVGPQYRTKAGALADLTRYAADNGTLKQTLQHHNQRQRWAPKIRPRQGTISGGDFLCQHNISVL